MDACKSPNWVDSLYISNTFLLCLLLQGGRACLSGLHCVKPERSEDGTKQSGQTTRCRLLLTVTHGSLQLQAAAPLVSEAFTVVTVRSRGAVKSVVPLPNEDVTKLEGIGKDAAASLKALQVVGGQQLQPVETVSGCLQCSYRR
jgi:hypothetical protein